MVCGTKHPVHLWLAIVVLSLSVACLLVRRDVVHIAHPCVVDLSSSIQHLEKSLLERHTADRQTIWVGRPVLTQLDSTPRTANQPVLTQLDSTPRAANQPVLAQLDSMHRTVSQPVLTQLDPTSHALENSRMTHLPTPCLPVPCLPVPCSPSVSHGPGRAKRRRPTMISPLLKDLSMAAGNIGVPLFLRSGTQFPVPGRVIVDAGSNNGTDWSFPALEAGHVVYAFELGPQPQAAFLERAKGYPGKVTVIDVVPGQIPVVPERDTTGGHIFFFKAGLSDKTDAVQVYLHTQSELSSLGNPPAYLADGTTVRTVAVLRLDDVLQDTDVWVFKSDTQGHEAAVYRGAERLLRDNHVEVLSFEFWPKGMKASGDDAETFLEWLSDLGYQCFDWSANRHIDFPRPDDAHDFVKQFYLPPRPNCQGECHEFGYWDEMLCAPLRVT